MFQGTLQQFVDDFFRSVLCYENMVPPAVKYFFDFLDEQALKHDNVDDETIHIWKTNRYEIVSFSYVSIYSISTEFGCTVPLKLGSGNQNKRFSASQKQQNT